MFIASQEQDRRHCGVHVPLDFAAREAAEVLDVAHGGTIDRERVAILVLPSPSVRLPVQRESRQELRLQSDMGRSLEPGGELD